LRMPRSLYHSRRLRGIHSRAITEWARSMSVLELRNAGGEPRPVGRVADEQHGARAPLGGRRQDVVDSEIAVRRERHAGRVRVALDDRRRWLADQRCEDAGVHVAADAVAAGQKESAPVDLDAAVCLHVRPEIGNDPDLAPAGLTPRTTLRVTVGNVPSA